MEKQLATAPQRPVKGRIRPALATAIRLIVEEGHTQADAAQAVGMNPVSLSLALKKPHVKALREAVKRAWLDNETGKAWLTVINLSNGAASEDVRLKAAKLLLEAAGELDGGRSDGDKGPKSLVQIVLHHPAEMTTVGGLPGVIEIIRSPGRSTDSYQLIEATAGQA
jgi:hypothetical protein